MAFPHLDTGGESGLSGPPTTSPICWTEEIWATIRFYFVQTLHKHMPVPERVREPGPGALDSIVCYEGVVWGRPAHSSRRYPGEMPVGEPPRRIVVSLGRQPASSIAACDIWVVLRDLRPLLRRGLIRYA